MCISHPFYSLCPFIPFLLSSTNPALGLPLPLHSYFSWLHLSLSHSLLLLTSRYLEVLLEERAKRDSLAHRQDTEHIGN